MLSYLYLPPSFPPDPDLLSRATAEIGRLSGSPAKPDSVRWHLEPSSLGQYCEDNGLSEEFAASISNICRDDSLQVFRVIAGAKAPMPVALEISGEFSRELLVSLAKTLGLDHPIIMPDRATIRKVN